MTNDAALAASALVAFKTLNDENKALTDELRSLRQAYRTTRDSGRSLEAGMDKMEAENRKLRDELTVAAVAARAANEFYRLEYMGEKTWLTPTETRERFERAMIAYREATGADNG